MTHRQPTSLLLLGLGLPLAAPLDTWLRAHVAEPMEIGSVPTLPEALTYLRSHCVDLVLVDEAAAQTDLRAIHMASPATAIIALVTRMEESVLLHTLRQGAHDALCLLPAADTDHPRTIERALARVGGRADLLKETAARPDTTPAAPRLIHDLNNLLTSINGFADLLLGRLAPDDPARMSAEQIRLAGKRAMALLKTHTTAPATDISSSRPTSTAQSIPAQAA